MITDSTLKARMDEFEVNQRKTLDILKRLEFAIMGDSELGHDGIIKTLDQRKKMIDLIVQDIIEIKKINELQNAAINAKKIQTDDWIKWGIRITVTLVIILLLSALITGKIGIVDIIKAAL